MQYHSLRGLFLHMMGGFTFFSRYISPNFFRVLPFFFLCFFTWFSGGIDRVACGFFSFLCLVSFMVFWFFCLISWFSCFVTAPFYFTP